LFDSAQHGEVELISLANEKKNDKIRSIRGKEISMIFQEPMVAFSPMYTIGNQINEATRLHITKDKKSNLAGQISLFDIASEEDYALIKAVLISVQSQFYSVDDKNLMAYSLKDISGDGEPEMIVFIEGKSDWLEEGRISIFSKVNGKPVCVASNIEWDIIDGDGRIYSYLQKSEYRSCTVFRLQKDGQSFETIAEFGYEFLSKRYYETVDGERVTISEDKYKKLEKKYCIHPFIVEDNVETMNESFGFGFSYFFDGATGMYPPAKSGK
jgi:ABC-type dipeptide/oligopeptide/nickel transport system ATPase component